LWVSGKCLESGNVVGALFVADLHLIVLLTVKTDHTVVEAPDESKKKARVGEKGNGTALTDMPRVVANISKIESGKREMKLLHK